MNNKKEKRIAIDFKFDNGPCIKQDLNIKDNLWLYGASIQIPSTEKKYSMKGKALTKLIKREGKWVSINKYNKELIEVSVELQGLPIAHSTEEFFENVDYLLEYIYSRLEKVDIRECRITLKGYIYWNIRKCV